MHLALDLTLSQQSPTASISRTDWLTFLLMGREVFTAIQNTTTADFLPTSPGAYLVGVGEGDDWMLWD